MCLVTGINHVAIITADIDRFIDFYAEMFGATVAFAETTPAFRHALVRVGAESVLHPVELTRNPHGTALPDAFERGHLDHLALTVAPGDAFEVVRQRLTAAGASDGAVSDLGAIHSIAFRDPDGMSGEVCRIVDPELSTVHAPRPLGSSIAVT